MWIRRLVGPVGAVAGLITVAGALADPGADAPASGDRSAEEAGSPSAPGAEPSDDAEAGEPSSAPASDEEGEARDTGGPAQPIAEEVIVYDDYLTEQARREVIGAAADLGYRTALRREGRTILRHDAVWQGEVVLHDDGRVKIKRQPVQFRPPFEKVTPLSWMSCILVPLCLKPNGQLVSPRRFHATKRRTWAVLEDEVTTWNERIADVALTTKIQALPERLEALWFDGQPLDGGEVLSTHAERRQALFDHWNSRTDNDWGHEVRAAVEAFCRGVVQPSDHPFTAEELARFDMQRRVRRPFDVPPVERAPSDGPDAPDPTDEVDAHAPPAPEADDR